MEINKKGVWLKESPPEEYIGNENLKRKLHEQVEKFEKLTKSSSFREIQSSHFDWWTFPINESSSHGLSYTVSSKVVGELKKDEQFVSELRKAVHFVLFAWGWDVERADFVDKPHKDQKWSNWPVRLYKASRSCFLFGQTDLYESLKKFAGELNNKGNSLKFSSTSAEAHFNLIERLNQMESLK